MLLLQPLLLPTATATAASAFCYSLVPHLLPLLLQPGTAPAATAATAWYRTCTCSSCCCYSLVPHLQPLLLPLQAWRQRTGDGRLRFAQGEKLVRT